MTINTSAKETIADVKRHIEDQESIAPNDQRLIFAGQQLEDHKTLGDYHIIAYCTLHLVMRLGSSPVPRGSMTVFIKTLTAKTFEIKTSPEETILDIKNKVTEMEGIPANQQRLVFGGKQLEDSHTLKEYNVSHESTFHLILRLRGQPGVP